MRREGVKKRKINKMCMKMLKSNDGEQYLGGYLKTKTNGEQYLDGWGGQLKKVYVDRNDVWKITSTGIQT